MDEPTLETPTKKIPGYKVWTVYASKPLVELATALMAKHQIGFSALVKRGLEALGREQ